MVPLRDVHSVGLMCNREFISSCLMWRRKLGCWRVAPAASLRSMRSGRRQPQTVVSVIPSVYTPRPEPSAGASAQLAQDEFPRATVGIKPILVTDRFQEVPRDRYTCGLRRSLRRDSTTTCIFSRTRRVTEGDGSGKCVKGGMPETGRRTATT